MKLLLLTYNFAPYNTVGAIRNIKFTKFLSRFGVIPYVFTSDRTDLESVPRMLLDIPKDVRIYRKKCRMRSIPGFYASTTERQSLFIKIKVFLKDILFSPDKYIWWNLSYLPKMIRFVKLSALMWIIHIFLDLSWGPLLLFWPVDPNLYDLSVYLRFENSPWLFFPLTFAGIIPEWTIYSQSEGQNIYFINMTQEQRQAIYGDYINLYIAQFTLHVIVFVVWFVAIVLPAFRRKKKKLT